MTATETIANSITPGVVAATSGLALGISSDILFGSFVGALAARVLVSPGGRPKDLWAWVYAAACMAVAILLSAAMAGTLAEWFESFDFVKSVVFAERTAGVMVAAGAQSIVEAIQSGPRAVIAKWTSRGDV